MNKIKQAIDLLDWYIEERAYSREEYNENAKISETTLEELEDIESFLKYCTQEDADLSMIQCRAMDFLCRR